MAMRPLLLSAALLLAGCTSGLPSALDQIGQQAVAVARGQQPAPFTATRASLAAAGFDQPLLVVTVPAKDEKAGLLRVATKGGTAVWRTTDATVGLRAEGGLLSGTAGFGDDLYSAETAPLRDALAAQGGSYTRAMRHLDGAGGMLRGDADCRLASDGPARIEILGRAHEVTAFTERCTLARPDRQQQIENRFWVKPGSAFVWASEQWVHPALGSILLERVIE